MPIERLDAIPWHAEGTLRAVTRWITSHNEGIAELLKNARRAYQVDRLNVAEEDRAAAILLKDGNPDRGVAARIAVLDVGGAALEDVEAWSVWHDPNASSRSSGMAEEETQGNGGKAYLYALFKGQCRFLGVGNRKRNCMGFDGATGSSDRGTPGWIPSRHEGREVQIASLDAELGEALRPYKLTVDDLPNKVAAAIRRRQAFTLVEGVAPLGLYRERLDAEELLSRVLRHEQCTLVVEQMDVYAMHNGQKMHQGKPLELPVIAPYPGLEQPVVFPIPEELALANDQTISTTEGGTREKGRLILLTSRENMHTAYKSLRPRWKMTYKTSFQVIGSKSVGEIVPGTSGAAFVYGTVELPALEPGYVETGRKRPKDGPLTEALDQFIGQRIREVAKKVNDLRKQELDERALDQVHEENRLLDQFKNSFLPSGEGPAGGAGEDEGLGKPERESKKRVAGTEAEELEYVVPEGGIEIALGVMAHMPHILATRVKDRHGKAVPSAKLEWHTSDPKVASITTSGTLEAIEGGKCDIWMRVAGTAIESEHIPVLVRVIEHVFLAPREMDVAIGSRQQVVAEVTDQDGERSTDVLLEWRHDADDQLIVRVGPRGWVTGNREGRTAVWAGARDLWAKRPVEVLVTSPKTQSKRTGGFPELRLTDRDLDPDTGQVREGNPDAPALWQETSDFVNNIWWLNVQSPEAAFAFRQRSEDPKLWRHFHVLKLMEMVELVWLDQDYTSKGDNERPDYWAGHRAALAIWQVLTVQSMWDRLEVYVQGGKLETEA